MLREEAGVFLILLIACSPPGDQRTAPDDDASVAAYMAVGVDVGGQVLDEGGAPLAGARVQLGGGETTTDADGRFLIRDRPRENAWLEVTAVAHRPTQRPLQLQLPTDTSLVEVGPVALQSSTAEQARFAFFGDTMFGRRFLDPDDLTLRNQVPPGDPEALIAVRDPLPGSSRALDWVAPWLEEPDVTVVNLESSILRDPATPHPVKDYVFFTLPESLDALVDAGVDYVSLGNNHIFDYLDAGVSDTLRLVSASGLAYSGAGLDLDAAYVPWYVDAGLSTHALVSASSIDGRKWDIHYNAEPDKGGAADLVDIDAFNDTMALAGLDDAVTIAQLHMGDEYTFEPTSAVRRHVGSARDAGAALVIGHHPHTAQGFSWRDGTLAAFSLGNFVFDSDRLETLLGVGLQADLRGGDLVEASALPLDLEDYRPRPAPGPAGARLLRRIGEFSRPDGVWVVPEAGVGWLARDEAAVEIAERTVEIEVGVNAARTAVIDLRRHSAADESLIGAQLDAPFSTAQLGRDLLVFGDMEDVDIDDDWGEVARWDTDRESAAGCMVAFSGVRGLCSTRDHASLDPSILALRQRVRVRGDAENAPLKDLDLVFYSRGYTSGATMAYVRWMASEGSQEFGEEILWARPGGSWPWTRTVLPLNMPADVTDEDAPEANPRSLRLFLRQDPPRERVEGVFAIDDVAIVSWEDTTLDLESGDSLSPPNGYEFMRLDAPPGVHTLTLTFARLTRRVD
ncbi:MAG: hypothetical protein ACI8PZ_000793 [Myxococcota bacterium]|jgi:hypothetical protein